MLLVAETYRHRILTGAWDAANRTWTAPETLAQVGGPVGPDGMAFDDQGLLHVAIFGQGIVAVIDSAGDVVARLPTPGARPTNLAFDPTGDLGMVATKTGTGRLLAFPGRRSASMLHPQRAR